MRLKPLNDRARQERAPFEPISSLPTDGVSVEILEDGQGGCYGDGRIHLPKRLFEPGNERELILTWNLELRHSRDFLDNIECILDVLGRGEDNADLKELQRRLEDRAEQNTGLMVDPNWFIDRGI